MRKMLRSNSTEDNVYHEMCIRAQNGDYTSLLRGKRCKTEDDFFNEVSASFQFPLYFGENWAAFDECICDLEWLKFNGIFIVIEDFDYMFGGRKSIQRLLLKYLKVMITYWEGEGIPVEIWLNNSPK